MPGQRQKQGAEDNQGRDAGGQPFSGHGAVREQRRPFERHADHGVTRSAKPEKRTAGGQSPALTRGRVRGARVRAQQFHAGAEPARVLVPRDVRARGRVRHLREHEHVWVHPAQAREEFRGRHNSRRRYRSQPHGENFPEHLRGNHERELLERHCEHREPGKQTDSRGRRKIKTGFSYFKKK